MLDAEIKNFLDVKIIINGFIIKIAEPSLIFEIAGVEAVKCGYK